MSCNVQELRKNLSDYIVRLGIEQRFLENPAFYTVVSEIDSLISQMNMFEDASKVIVKEDRKLSFCWTVFDGTEYEFVISSPSPQTFMCVKSEKKVPFKYEGELLGEKTFVELVATIDKSNFITLITNGSTTYFCDSKNGKCQNFYWTDMRYYTCDGFMNTQEYQSFPIIEISENYRDVTSDVALAAPRQVNLYANPYDLRYKCTRSLDSVSFCFDDKRKQKRYSGTVPLEYEHGLRNEKYLELFNSGLSQESGSTKILRKEL